MLQTFEAYAAKIQPEDKQVGHRLISNFVVKLYNITLGVIQYPSIFTYCQPFAFSQYVSFCIVSSYSMDGLGGLQISLNVVDALELFGSTPVI